VGSKGKPGTARALSAVALVLVALFLSGADWPTYLSDGSRSAAGSDTTLSTGNASQLTKLWAFPTGAAVAPSPTVVGGVVYVGSWDGNEYALDAASGSMIWKTFIGTTNIAGCSPPNLGVTSAATVLNGVVYVGGGDSNWYALDATNGNVLWSVPTGDNSASGGHYNWSSPLIYTASDAVTYGYIGVSSNCDSPLVQGQLIQVNLATHQVVHTFAVVPSGSVGGGIWTSPAVDPATNRIFMTTGTIVMSDSAANQKYSEAIVEVDATNVCSLGCGTAIDSWQLPANQRTTDSDWGTTPTLFSDSGARNLVGAINKNGFVYAWDRSNLSAGPVWTAQIAIGGQCPTCGDGSVSSMAFAAGTLFAAGGHTTISGVNYNGSVRAIDPATGNFKWQHGASGVVIPALAYDNGLVIDGAGSTLEVLDATNGSRIYSFKAGSVFYGAPSVASGQIFAGSFDKNVYAFGIGTNGLPPPPGYTLDGWGGIHAFGGAPAPSGGMFWRGWDIARGITVRSDGSSGWVLDGWGGVHPYGGAPWITNGPFWNGWDIARSIALNPCDPDNGGYVLDGWGGVHAFGTAPAVSSNDYWRGWDIARGIALNSCSGNTVSGYILDGWGGVHPFWQTGSSPTSTPTVSQYWFGWDIARGLVVTAAGSGYVLDGWGGIHPFGSAGWMTATSYSAGQDIARGIGFVSSVSGGYVLDAFGHLHPWWINSHGAIGSPSNQTIWTWKIARGVGV
jgi:outer membrane protein assembly factor BamB